MSCPLWTHSNVESVSIDHDIENGEEHCTSNKEAIDLVEKSKVISRRSFPCSKDKDQVDTGDDNLSTILHVVRGDFPLLEDRKDDGRCKGENDVNVEDDALHNAQKFPLKNDSTTGDEDESFKKSECENAPEFYQMESGPIVLFLTK